MIDVATDAIETPEQVAATIAEAAKYVAKEKIIAGTDCGHGADTPRHYPLPSSQRSARGRRWRASGTGVGGRRQESGRKKLYHPDS